MTQPNHGGRWLRDPETGALAREAAVDLPAADAQPSRGDGFGADATLVDAIAALSPADKPKAQTKGR